MKIFFSFIWNCMFDICGDDISYDKSNLFPLHLMLVFSICLLTSLLILVNCTGNLLQNSHNLGLHIVHWERKVGESSQIIPGQPYQQDHWEDHRCGSQWWSLQYCNHTRVLTSQHRVSQPFYCPASIPPRTIMELWPNIGLLSFLSIPGSRWLMVVSVSPL